MRRALPRLLAAGIAVGLLGCRMSQAPQWDALVNEFLESHFTANPAAAASAGRHEFDGRIADLSTAGLRAEAARLHQMREQALRFDSARLDSARRFERDYLLSVIDGQLFWLERAEWPWRNPQYYADALDPNVYVTREYAPLTERMKAVTRWARAIPAAAAQVRANLRTPLPPTYADIGRTQFGGLASFLEGDVPAVFASVGDSVLRGEFTAATAEAVRALKKTDAWFATERKRATGSFVMGPALFAEMLKATEMVDVPLERLEAIGQADLERNLEALKDACGRYAPGRPVKECVDRVDAHKPKSGIVEGARAQLAGLEAFIRTHDLVTIPGTEVAIVKESPPYMRWNSAFINTRGPFEKELPSIYYVSPPDPKWTKAEQAAYIPGTATLLSTTVHEVWPGHFLQFLHSNRTASKIGRVFVGYGFSEGWAHYAEELMWEAGLGSGDPETHIGQLGDALLRNVRYLSAIGLHTKGMTVEESERMFRDQAYQDPGTARQQAARGTFDPAYLNYTLGKLMIRKLRDDWTAPRGGRKVWKEFHDAFLSFGGPPVPLVRRAMLAPKAGPPL